METTKPEVESPLLSKEAVKSLVIRFAGDSGDGIQLTGDRLAKISAVFGNDVVTLADFPAEIRAPAGTLYGVSGYQIHVGAEHVHTPGDEVDVLVVMNPAALKTNLSRLKKGGFLLINSDGFSTKNLDKAGYEESPLGSNALEAYSVFEIPLVNLTRECLKDSGIPVRNQDRCKNFLALGLVCWLTGRPIKPTQDWISEKFKKQDVAEANKKVLQAGWNLGEAKEIFEQNVKIEPVGDKTPGTYRYINGNTALALGLVSASVRANRRLFFGSYPITPASDILHALAQHRNFGVTTFQAEDEIAAIGSAVGASFSGALAVTSTSGPGLALKSEFLNLAVVTELPLVVIDVQRAGPATGMPTKMEQSDLYMALWGRNGESPIVVLAPKSPSECFSLAIEASRIAVKYMTPVVILSDGFLANGSEAWKVPQEDELPEFEQVPTELPEGFQPYQRDEKTLARPWVVPGIPGGNHRIGGLEKEDITGSVSYDPDNHQKMVNLRAEKIARVTQEIPPIEIYGPEKGDVLVLGWGSSYGAIRRAVTQLERDSIESSHAHLSYISPFPKDLEGVLSRFKRVLVPEINKGQLLTKLRAEFPETEFHGLSKVKGLPFSAADLKPAIANLKLEGRVPHGDTY